MKTKLIGIGVAFLLAGSAYAVAGATIGTPFNRPQPTPTPTPVVTSTPVPAESDAPVGEPGEEQPVEQPPVEPVPPQTQKINGRSGQYGSSGATQNQAPVEDNSGGTGGKNYPVAP